METITTSTELKNAIQVLEFEQALKKELLKEQVYQIYENLKPVNLIKNTLSEVATSRYLTNNILGATVGSGNTVYCFLLKTGGTKINIF